MGEPIRVAAAGVVLLMALRACAVFCVVSAESTEQAFNVSQKDGIMFSRVHENVDKVDDQYMSSTEDEAGSTEQFSGETDEDGDGGGGSTMDEQDEAAASVGIHHRSGSQRRFMVAKNEKNEKNEPHGDRCWRAAQCTTRHFQKPGCCNKKCVNLYSDAMHCGKCGEKCKAGFRCDEGKCKKLPQPKRCGVHAECKKGFTCCKNRSCVNLYSNAMHCGKCGRECKKGFRCDEGKCMKLPEPKRCGVHAKCKKGFTCCENKCVKLNGSDKFNCGKCGRKCGFGSVCCTGECKYIYKSDAEHCGGCHKKCKQGVKCSYGICGYN